MGERKNIDFVQVGIGGAVGGLVVLAVVFALAEFGWSPFRGGGPGKGGSSVVKVQGGSIHGGVTAPDVWTQVQATASYSAEPHGGDDHITTNGFQGANLSNLTGTGGWMITITNADTRGHELQKALTMCSDPNCSMSSAGNGVVYFSTGRNGVRLDPYSNTEIRFHDDQNCDNMGTGEDARCDKIVHATISTSLKGSSTLSCSDPDPGKPSKGCWIQIGQ